MGDYMLYGLKRYPNRIAGACIWLLALGTTITFLQELGAEAAWAVAGSLAIQLLLTYLEHFVWSPAQGSSLILSYTALAVDGFINFGGAWPIVQRLAATSSYQSMVAGLGLQASALPTLLSFVLAVALSILLCASPEKLWSMDRSRAPVKPPKGHRMGRPADYFAFPKEPEV